MTNSELLLIENLPGEGGILKERAHALAQSDNDFKRAFSQATRGDYITLEPTLDHLLVFIQEAWTGVVLEDDFSSYKDHRWRPIGDFETDETWVGGQADTTNEVEGSQGWECPTTDKTAYRDFGTLAAPELDLENEDRFGDDDYVVVAVYVHASGDSGGEYTLEFYSGAADSYRSKADGLGQGWLLTKHKRSEFTEAGSPDWEDIFRVMVRSNTGAVGNAAPQDVTFDWLRLEKADPDDATVPNPTGTVWDFQPNSAAWTITEDVSGADATLACLDIEADVEKVALIDETLTDIRYRARVMAKRDAGKVGIIWRAEADTLTEGAEDCFVAYLDITTDRLRVHRFDNGVDAVVEGENDFECAVDTWYTIGVINKGIWFKVYAAPTASLTEDDDIWDDQYFYVNGSSPYHPSGMAGVISIGTLGRFDEVKLLNIQDKVVPADEITLQGWAIFRTIAPFVE